MSETQEETPNNQANPELDELMANMEKMNEGLSGLMVSTLRMQMLILEDTQNMMAEFSKMSAAVGGRNANKGDI